MDYVFVTLIRQKHFVSLLNILTEEQNALQWKHVKLQYQCKELSLNFLM